MNDITDIGTLARSDDSAMGLAMFVIFTAAALIVTGAVALLALINTWWLLGLAFAVHVIMTTVVGFVVFSALSGETGAIRDREPESVREAPRTLGPRREAVGAHL